MRIRYYYLLVIGGLLAGCQTSSEKSDEVTQEAQTLEFESLPISQAANLWWARTLADVNGDKILDVVLHDNNGAGGWLGYLQGNLDGAPWETVIVAEESPNGKKFAAGDLDCGDIDGDGDIDLIGVEHPGEWTDADADATLYWYEQKQDGWQPHLIGVIPSALKDISLVDLDQDGRPEVVTVTYNAETLTLFSQGSNGSYHKVWDRLIDNLHEGLDVGDVDGDGWMDIVANGYWLKNPQDLNQTWTGGTIDAQWFNQEEDHWSRNATKIVCADVDDDGRAEVFISHSEKKGYPVARYDLEDENWMREILVDSLPAAHSLVVADLDLDGVPEVLTGVNRNRAINIVEESGDTIVPTEFPVLMIRQDSEGWDPVIINQDGVYNLLAGDIDFDGDIDLVRLTSHDEKDMWLMKNRWID